MPDLISFADVVAAADRIRPHIHHTPVVTSSTVDAESGAAVFFKCENLQKVGAFKARGAANAVLSLPEALATRRVVTHSSGNHGQALAYAASIRSVPCVVVMPDDAPGPKVEAVRGYGATIVFCPQQEREETAARILEESGGVLVHPFDDPRVIAGQGTAALELLEEVADLDVVITPVGGGGLMSGTAIAVRDRLPRARLIGVEPRAADDAYRSLASGVLQPAVADPETLADGLRMGLSELTFAHLQQLGVEVVTVDEPAIADAARFHLERMKLVVEPSGATALAALRALDVSGMRVGVILSGGNTDFGWLSV
jgi:threonine dehydratase/serine racemase